MMQILVGRSKLAWGAFHWAAWLSEAPGHWTGWGSRICTSRRGRARCRPPPARPLSGSAPPGRPQAGASPRWPSRNHRPARASVMMVGRCKRKQKRVTGWAVAHQVQDNVRLGARRWCGWLAADRRRSRARGSSLAQLLVPRVLRTLASLMGHTTAGRREHPTVQDASGRTAAPGEEVATGVSHQPTLAVAAAGARVQSAAAKVDPFALRSQQQHRGERQQNMVKGSKIW